MKSKDVSLILIMVFIGAVVAILVSHLVFNSPTSRQQTAETVDSISAQFSTPPDKYFNSSAINPAPNINIGDNNNNNPFNSSSH